MAPEGELSPTRVAVETMPAPSSATSAICLMDFLKGGFSVVIKNQEGANRDSQFSMVERKLEQLEEKQATSGSSGSGAAPASMDVTARNSSAAPEDKFEAEALRVGRVVATAAAASASSSSAPSRSPPQSAWQRPTSEQEHLAFWEACRATPPRSRRRRRGRRRRWSS